MKWDHVFKMDHNVHRGHTGQDRTGQDRVAFGVSVQLGLCRGGWDKLDPLIPCLVSTKRHIRLIYAIQK